ncbi:hypothetical protein AAHA92_17187 [Salvia divinorum]|uniref:Uncharacterized protein n=1 Tax=Salvia divinorum TaxID=28513 RepID=A0ABD1GYH0_SALDI
MVRNGYCPSAPHAIAAPSSAPLPMHTCCCPVHHPDVDIATGHLTHLLSAKLRQLRRRIWNDAGALLPPLHEQHSSCLVQSSPTLPLSSGVPPLPERHRRCPDVPPPASGRTVCRCLAGARRRRRFRNLKVVRERGVSAAVITSTSVASLASSDLIAAV